MSDSVLKELYGKVHTEPVVEDRPMDRDREQAMAIQLRWLALPEVKARRARMGWDGRITHGTNLTFRDVRDRECYGWHKWMVDQIQRGGK